MAIIGFIALILVGLYLMLAGGAAVIITHAFTGKLTRPESLKFAVVIIVGMAIIYTAFVNSPIHIQFTQ